MCLGHHEVINDIEKVTDAGMSRRYIRNKWVWKYFEELKYFQAQCKLCPRSDPTVLMYRDMTNVRYHLELQHENIFFCDLNYCNWEGHLYKKHNIHINLGKKLETIFIWNYIEEYDKNLVRCLVCDDMIILRPVKALNNHMFDEHRDIWNKEQTPQRETDMPEPSTSAQR
nr:PREDICTED: uncharacterized protein LOC105674412 [Linepithema humile]